MTEAQWAQFDEIGGTPRLRKSIDAIRTAYLEKKARNDQIKAERAQGQLIKIIAWNHGITISTVHRILSGYKDPRKTNRADERPWLFKDAAP